jgi:hypothetical protein
LPPFLLRLPLASSIWARRPLAAFCSASSCCYSASEAQAATCCAGAAFIATAAWGGKAQHRAVQAAPGF